MSGPEQGKGQPIIVKRVKKGGGGHHGGSWKVAYADFVTAMMAFFLLMWLLGSVEQDTKDGVANYFKRPLKSLVSMGSYGGGDRIQATSSGSNGPGMMAPGSGGKSPEREEERQFEMFLDRLDQEVTHNAVLQTFKDQIQIERVPEGVRLHILDKYNLPMFATGSAAMQPYARTLLRELAPVIATMPNPIVISGHTDATPFAGGNAGYGNWELSADRANAARRELVAGSLRENKVVCIEGLAHTMLAEDSDPYSPINRRISILLLNQKAASAYVRPPATHNPEAPAGTEPAERFADVR